MIILEGLTFVIAANTIAGSSGGGCGCGSEGELTGDSAREPCCSCWCSSSEDRYCWVPPISMVKRNNVDRGTLQIEAM
jgi:hypothetical protein